MKSFILGIVALSCVVSYGALSGSDAAWETQIEWSPKIGFDSTTTNYNSGSPWNKHLMGTGGNKARLEELRTDGATLSGFDGEAADANSLRLGRANSHTSSKNFWMQPVDLKNVNGASGLWGEDINADPYIYAVSNQQIKLSIKVSDINLSADPSKNAKFVFNLWDKKRPDVRIGLMIHDPNNGNQEHIRLSTYGTANIFETGTLSDGSNSAPAEQNKRVTAYYITPADGTEVMGSSESYEFDLRFDRVTGEYAVDVNGTQVLSGQMATNENGIAGIDGYGWEFNNMSPGDSIDIESFSISSISEIVPVLDAIDVYYQETSSGTNVFDLVNGYTPNTNGNLLSSVGYADYGSEVNWTNIIQVGNPVAWSASTPTVAGTNATKVTSIWKWKAEGGGGADGPNDNIENNGMILSNNEDLWVAPGAGDYVFIGNSYTKYNIDSDVSVAAIVGNARKDQGSELGSILSVKDGGSLTVEGTVAPEYNLSWLDGVTQLGNWGNSNTTDYAMTLEIDGGSFTNLNVVNVAHSRATGNLNITTNGGSIVADRINVGYDAPYRSTGTVNIAGGSLTANQLFVGNASPGVVNVTGGQLILPDSGSIRIGYRRNGVTAGQHGAGGVGTVDFNGSGLIDISGGTLNATASNTFVNVGMDDLLSGGTNEVEYIYGGSSKTAELRIGDGGTANFSAGNKLIIGRDSDGILTIADGGTLNAADETLSIGYGPENGTLNMTGGAINLTGNRIDIGGWAGGNATVNMSGGTITADSIVMQNHGDAYTNNGVSTVNQTGGIVTTTGAEARFGVDADAVYNIGGSTNVAKLIVNPMLESFTATSNNLGKINLSYGEHDSTLNILTNGIVHVNSIALDSVNVDNDSETDAAVLSLNPGGTFLVEGNYAGALGFADGAQMNISGGQIIWRRGSAAATSNMLALASYINLTGGQSEVPTGSGNIREVFTQGDYTLYSVGYSTASNVSYSVEADTNAYYTRFVSVDTSSLQSPYDIWATANGVSGAATDDDDSDGISNYMEFALGGNPTDGSDVGVLSSVVTMQKQGEDFDRIMLVHPRAKGTHGLNYTTEHTTDMTFGTWSSDDVVEEGVDTSGAVDMVTNSVPATNSAGFLRLQVELPE